MADKKILVVIKRINGEWFRLSCPSEPPDKQLSYRLSGGIRDYTGTSRSLLGQQEVSLQLFPGEQVVIEEAQ